jgi:hypothetical protein
MRRRPVRHRAARIWKKTIIGAAGLHQGPGE